MSGGIDVDLVPLEKKAEAAFPVLSGAINQ